ncbi:similar to Saccharomyces cerevisiae YDL057W Putative protein of unknown function [Maudiozyma barnettii]|uniref:Serine aminopeptidase S33 domain-containing protein n=1 Tax=Maudiozyma barnettii TaxID=61262 RepID=A0A8H2ZMC9_9SACH|nr:hypothetical protein [Kazachstania barnettii]CAB4256972.1 similar to Saccharomyces cerevisiae YDL057W Putative protein of unknown function [Kazachstania barnettii]CAD1779343.1 similar to Saccharomyces cerevisiae YDL057W Putative protein of unknown function [Kazachstania barnettii]
MDYETVTPNYIKLEKNELFVNVLGGQDHFGDIAKLATIISLPVIGNDIEPHVLKVATLLHGHQSHKNAIYQPLLAQTLSNIGYCVIRFDFRGQGDSSPNEFKMEGRTIEQDVNDIHTICTFICKGPLLDLVNMKLREHMPSNDSNYESVCPKIMVAHSRGVLAMFEYLLACKEFQIPLIVNCCGRFDGSGLLTRYTKIKPTWRKEGGLNISTLRYGKYEECWVPTPEILSTAKVDTLKFNDINQSFKVLSVYGSKDLVVPVEDGEKYEKLFQERGLLLLIDGADHNFYGLPEDPNIHKLPLKRGKVNYSILFISKFMKYLEG